MRAFLFLVKKLFALFAFVLMLSMSVNAFSQQYSSSYIPPLNNLTATAAPLSTNDSSQGYAVGSLWQNTTTGTAYIAKSVGVGAAVWTALN